MIACGPGCGEQGCAVRILGKTGIDERQHGGNRGEQALRRQMRASGMHGIPPNAMIALSEALTSRPYPGTGQYPE